MSKRILIIAEAGVNHNGDINLAKQLIEIAADAGADVVKFQTFNAARLVLHNAIKADYQLKTSDSNETQFTMLSKLELTESMHHQLIAHCKLFNIGFLSTAFDIESVNLLVGLNQKLFKVPSGEITNLPYLRHIGKLNKKVILSSGMSSIKEVKDAVKLLNSSGTSRNKITVLHCTSEYPTPMNEVNLLAMQSISSDLGLEVGYSDHTIGIEVAIAAAAMGASVIEKHFTINRNLPGPDHQASLEPGELKDMIFAIRNIEIAMGDGVKDLSPSEVKNQPVIRKSLVALKAIEAGELFTNQNVTTKRPGTGISPMRWDEFIGKPAQKNYKEDDLI
jgi:N,N'-diacetyllegionaminate synthase